MSYDVTWDRPHIPGREEGWQESDCYWFYDKDQGIGGYHRVGQYPNRKTGQTLLFAYKRDGKRFKMVRDTGDCDLSITETGQRVGSSFVDSIDEGRLKLGWNEPDCAADLEFYDQFYQPRSWVKDDESDSGADVRKNMNMNDAGHLEVAGRIKGTMRFGGDIFEVNALAHRDRSWGLRDYSAMYQHRMVTGTVGPELSWATLLMQLENGAVLKTGFIARNGETQDIVDLQVITAFDYDGLTVAGMKTSLTLENGEVIELEGNATQGSTMLTEGWLLSSHHVIEINHNGYQGFTILDTTNRPTKGEFIPQQSQLSMVCMDEGLSDSQPYHALK